MPLRSLKMVTTSNKDIDKIQSNVEQAINPLLGNPLLDGVLLKNIVLSASSSNEIEHKLARKPIGWIITRNRADSRVWDTQDTNTSPSKTLSLSCSHTTTIDIWVF